MLSSSTIAQASCNNDSMPPSPRSQCHSRPLYNDALDAPSLLALSRHRTSLFAVPQPSSYPVELAEEGAIEDPTSTQELPRNSHGNLADELAEILDDGEEDEGPLRPPSEPTSAPSSSTSTLVSKITDNDIPTSAMADPSGVVSTRSDDLAFEAEEYNGLNTEELSGLDLNLIALEEVSKALGSAGPQDHESSVITLAQSLRDLPTQSAIENAASRLMTSHVALSSHITNQGRMFQSLVHPVMSPFATNAAERDLDVLLPLVTDLMTAIPFPRDRSLAALSELQSLTLDLGQTLTYLSDSIYMMRQTLSLANRKLRLVAEMVDDLKRDCEAEENAIRWIEKEQWDRRLLNRQCGSVCGDVIGGFEHVCRLYRQQLLAG